LLYYAGRALDKLCLSVLGQHLQALGVDRCGLPVITNIIYSDANRYFYTFDVDFPMTLFPKELSEELKSRK
jgi:hypothetical protein